MATKTRSVRKLYCAQRRLRFGALNVDRDAIIGTLRFQPGVDRLKPIGH
jgi:hypothetical protein